MIFEIKKNVTSSLCISVRSYQLVCLLGPADMEMASVVLIEIKSLT